MGERTPLSLRIGETTEVRYEVFVLSVEPYRYAYSGPFVSRKQAERGLVLLGGPGRAHIVRITTTTRREEPHDEHD